MPILYVWVCGFAYVGMSIYVMYVCVYGYDDVRMCVCMCSGVYVCMHCVCMYDYLCVYV
jgi:hypothetical protein